MTNMNSRKCIDWWPWNVILFKTGHGLPCFSVETAELVGHTGDPKPAPSHVAVWLWPNRWGFWNLCDFVCNLAIIGPILPGLYEERMRHYGGHSIIPKSKNMSSADIYLVDPMLFEKGKACFKGYARPTLAVLRSFWPFSCSVAQDWQWGTLQEERSRCPVIWVRPVLACGAKEGENQGLWAPLCRYLRQWLFLWLSKTASFCNTPFLPLQPEGLWEWLSVVDNFWTVSSSLFLDSWFFYHCGVKSLHKTSRLQIL